MAKEKDKDLEALLLQGSTALESLDQTETAASGLLPIRRGILFEKRQASKTAWRVAKTLSTIPLPLSAFDTEVIPYATGEEKTHGPVLVGAKFHFDENTSREYVIDEPTTLGGTLRHVNEGRLLAVSTVYIPLEDSIRSRLPTVGINSQGDEVRGITLGTNYIEGGNFFPDRNLSQRDTLLVELKRLQVVRGRVQKIATAVRRGSPRLPN